MDFSSIRQRPAVGITRRWNPSSAGFFPCRDFGTRKGARQGQLLFFLFKLKTKKSVQNRRRPGRKGPRSRSALQTEWDQASRWYDALVGGQGTPFQKEIIMPGAFKLMELKKGDRVLDLACGQGVFSRFLSRKGLRVEGLDSSGELIRRARSRSRTVIDYHTADARDPKIFPEARFDAVACLLALQNMEDILPVFQNVSRWMKPEGRFVMVLTHPCFRIPRQTHWGWDEEKKLEYRRVDHYASEITIPILTPPMARSKVYTQTFHRPLQSYFQALSLAGLCVDGLEEWVSPKKSQPGKRARAENRARMEIPLFMAMRVRHLPRWSKKARGSS